MKQAVILMFFSLFFVSCSEEEKPKGEPELFWVYSYPFLCGPPSPVGTPCLAITYSEEFDFDYRSLEMIPFEIEGYTYKPYYFQKLQVQKFKDLKKGEIKRKLIRVLAEEKDYYELLEGSWKVTRYQGKGLPNEIFPNGQTVGLLPIIRTAGSTDGCNSITVQIKKVGPDKILSFGEMHSTLIGCSREQMIIPFPGLGRNFKREGNKLTFFSEEEGEVAVWEKIN